MTIDRAEIEKYFSVGDDIPTISKRSSFKITGFCDIKVKITISSGESRWVKYQQMTNIIEGKNAECRTYTSGLAKEYIKRQATPYLQTDFDKAVEQSKQFSPAERQARLQNAPKKPEKVTSTSVSFKRNPDVVAEVLVRANGICEQCKNPAPFIRKSDNTPYLEVHHKQRLADDGDDTVENAMALCPNCHRQAHFG